MKRLAAAAFALSTLVVAARGGAEERCRFEGLRVLVADAGEGSIVELSARVRSETGGTCTVEWSRVSLSSPAGGDAAPTIAVAQTFLDHRLLSPMVVADGVAAVVPRDYRGEPGVISVRWFVEGTAAGLRVEVPRAAFPKPVAGARVERRVKSARTGSAKFGPLGDIDVVPSAPGPAGGVGPAGPANEERIVVEMVPTGPVLEAIPTPLLTLEAMRGTLPLRVLDLSPANEDGWNEVARRAYAAAIHGDPLVASMGVHTLAWLGSGLSLQAVKIGKTAAGPETAVIPASVVDTIGDVDARVQKRQPTVGRLLPLGRNAVFRKALAARPWDEAPRAAAAKAAVARLAAVPPQDLMPFLMPAIVDGMAAPIDPPQPVAGEPEPVIPGVPKVDEGPALVATKAVRAKTKRPRGKRVGLFFGLLAAAAVIGWQLRESRDR